MKTLLRVCIIIFNLIFIISHMSVFKQESELEIAVRVDVTIAIVTIIKTDRGIIKSTKKGKKIMLNQNKQIIKENEEKKRSIACLVIGIVFLILCVSSFSKTVIGTSECYGDIIAQLQVLDINNLQMATLILKLLGVIVGQPYKTCIDVFCYMIDIWKYIKKRKTR